MITIHKSHTRNDLISMAENLPLPITYSKSDMKDAFKKKVKESDDLIDLLPELVQHLKEHTGATATYIGVVDKPIKGIKDGLEEDADDKAHLIPGAK